MSLTQKDVLKVAKLARIRLQPEEIDQRTQELNNIFAFVEELQKVNTDGVEPLASIGDFTQRLREDVVNDGSQQEAVLKNATGANYGCFVVPKVVE